MIAKKHEYFDKKRATLIGTEIASSTAATLFIPGIDIAYYFAKGAIIREEHPNWFKSGVLCAYHNSILWFTLKGKNIELQEGDKIQLKYFENAKLENKIEKIDERKEKDKEKELKQEEKKKEKEMKEALQIEEELEKQKTMTEDELKEYLTKKEEKRVKKETKEIRKQFEYENWKEKWDEKNAKKAEKLEKQAELKKQKKLLKEQN